MSSIELELCAIRDHLVHRDSNDEFERLLKNKRVAVVGPARTLIGSRQGQSIDDYDIIVRFNDAFRNLPVPPALAVDVGTRADILYCNQVILRKDILQQKGIRYKRLANVCREAGTRFFVCTNNGLDFDRNGLPKQTCSRADRNIHREFSRLLEAQRINTTFRTVFTASETIMRWMGGQCGRTGFVAIVDLLHFDIAELYITGMTFYHGGGHLLAPETTELHPLKNRDGSWARDESGLGHDSFVELKLMRWIMQCFGKKIHTDGVLSGLLQQPH